MGLSQAVQQTGSMLGNRAQNPSLVLTWKHLVRITMEVKYDAEPIIGAPPGRQPTANSGRFFSPGVCYK